MRAQTCRVLPFRDTRQVCARIRQGYERLACHPARMRRGAPRSAHPGAKVPPKDRIYIDGPDRPRCGLKEAAGQGVVLSAATARAPKNPILWRDFCMASRAYAPERLFRVPSALFPAGRGVAVHPGCRRGRRKATQRAVGPNIKQCMLCIKPRSAMRGCAEGRKALRLMREALLYRRFTSKKWSITKPRHGDTLSGKYLPLGNVQFLAHFDSGIASR